MLRALLTQDELRLLAKAIGRDLATVEHDGFQVVLNLRSLRLALLPFEVVVPHPHSSHVDVDRLAVELRPAEEPPSASAVEVSLGMITAIAVARTLIRLEPAEQLLDSDILGVAAGPSTSVEAVFYHPSDVAAAAEGAAALALTDVGLRITMAAGRSFWLAAQGFFIVPYLRDSLPEGWEGTIQYLSLDGRGSLAA